MAEKASQDRNQSSFEEMMQRLEQIVTSLEGDDLPLEQSIALFEEGMGLTRSGMALLDHAEQKVSLLLQEDGQTRPVPFDLDGGGES